MFEEKNNRKQEKSENTTYKKISKVHLLTSEATTGGVLLKKLFSKISQILQENSCVGVSL